MAGSRGGRSGAYDAAVPEKDRDELRRRMRAIKDGLERLRRPGRPRSPGVEGAAGGPAVDRSVRAAQIAAAVNQQVAEKFSAKLREHPEALERLVALGLADEAWLEGASVDATAVLGRLRNAGTSLAGFIRERPSVLSDLRVTALELMAGGADDSSEPGAGGTGDVAPGFPRADRVVVFTDLEGFTSFTASEGDEAAGRLLTALGPQVDGVVRSRGGSVVKSLGDGHLLAFEHAEAAVLASLELVDAAPHPLRLRAGAHAGPVLVSDGDLFGHTVNVAARVAGEASGGEALVTGTLRERIGSLHGIVFSDPVERLLRGLAEPVPVWSVRRV